MYKILVVDDDPNIRIGLSRMIQNAYPDTVITDTAETDELPSIRQSSFILTPSSPTLRCPYGAVWNCLRI